MNAAIAFVHEQLTGKLALPEFKAGDNITVNYKIIEGNKERIQSFKGDVIKRQGYGAHGNFYRAKDLRWCRRRKDLSVVFSQYRVGRDE